MFEVLQRQLLARLDEGQGETIYEVGGGGEQLYNQLYTHSEHTQQFYSKALSLAQVILSHMYIPTLGEVVLCLLCCLVFLSVSLVELSCTCTCNVVNTSSADISPTRV